MANNKYTIDNDLENESAYSCFLKNPKITNFKPIYNTKPTHFNKFTVIIENTLDNNNALFTMENNTNIAISNGVIQIKSSVLYAFFEEIEITMEHNNKTVTLLKLSYDDLITILKHKFNYDIYKNYDKTSKLIIPFQKLIIDEYLFINKNMKLNVKLNSSINDSSTLNKICTTSLIYEKNELTYIESMRFHTDCWEKYINSYENIYGTINDDTFTINFKNYSKPIYGIYIGSSNVDGINLVNLKCYNEDHYIHSIETLNAYENYVYNKQICVDKNMYVINFDNNNRTHGIFAGKFYGDENKNLIITGKNGTKLNIIINYFNILIYDDNTIELDCLKERLPDYNNFYPLTKLSDNKYVEGYWFNSISEQTSTFPFPKETEKIVDINFLNKLKNCMSILKKIDYCGPSMCRICKQCNGNIEYELIENDVKYLFPEGVMHYYQDHNVQPSDEFYALIMNFNSS